MKNFLMMGALTLGVAAAQNGTSPVRLTASTYVVTQAKDASGKTTEKLVDVSGKGAIPGSTLQMSQKVVNVSTRKVTGLRLTMPVDPATTFVSQNCTLSGVKALYSIDPRTYDPKTKALNVASMKFAEAPLKKTVTVRQNGVDVKREVTVEPSEYTAVRWQLPEISPNQNGECSLRVRVR